MRRRAMRKASWSLTRRAIRVYKQPIESGQREQKALVTLTPAGRVPVAWEAYAENHSARRNFTISHG